MSREGAPEGGESTSITETLQALLVAFVVAMTFRGFFLEGFVIPTGSMAPTLMGAHLRFRSPETAYEFAIDAGPVAEAAAAERAGVSPRRRWAIFDPMLGYAGIAAEAATPSLLPETRMGDRVLVLKFLYPFSEPKRWDVVVFKNPTDPVGATHNYIKRLVGLPEERLLLADGDVFAAPTGTPVDSLRIQRKPEHVQRAVWQPVYDSDYIPVNRSRLEQAWRQAFPLPPWKPVAGRWELGDARVWRSEGDGELRWDWQALPIDDRTPYNMFRPVQPFYPVSDLRIAAAVEAEDPAAFSTSLDLRVRSHVVRFELRDGRAAVSMRHLEGGAAGEAIVAEEAEVRLPGSGAFEVEFWHVDQAISIWVDGREAVRLEYEWGPIERLRSAFFGRTLEQYLRDPVAAIPTPPDLAWRFAGGGPVELRRVRLDRDLYYRPMRLTPFDAAGASGRPLPTLGFGCDPESPAELVEDQFMMLGDNSAASRDSRVWGYPHPLAELRTGDGSPFVVPRSMLLGKAWCVYFPAPLPYTPGGRAVVPDFGRLRFIR
jgi:signal peptidase I